MGSCRIDGSGGCNQGDCVRPDLRQEAELLPIASRIRDAIAHRPLDASQLLQCVNHLLKMAGNPKLMSPSVATTTE